ncbi:TetR/AcrR family transcriptional regulator [Antrihabitans sp. YC2-6]|uniref:TetR/AcrR family transcriptional regulator n=1 Tax=Antrihabitans sp. YC2-6 TaxID=2799498 RepID=UPI0018F70845|nr:TetR family transcriptional regulator [Antrihabitans sp. YC2-6]MBJ8346216.1 TetR family transcriptional regulator [Antrihabitans sp. YC2-6]
MQRLSRAESQLRTRAAILSAAHKLFLRNGFRSTSLEQIAQEAGYTQGAVYSNFRNKSEIGIAVIDQMYDDEERRLLELFTNAVAHGRGWQDAILEWTRTGSLGDVGWARLETEVAAFSTDDGKLRAATADRYTRIRQRWGRLIESTADAAGITLPVSHEVLAIGLLGLSLGVGLQRAADPSVSGNVVAELLQALATQQGFP